MPKMKDSGIEWIGKIPEDWEVLRNKYNFSLNKNIVGIAYPQTQLLSLTKNGVKAINEDEQKGKVPTSFSTYQTVDKDDIVMCLFDLDVSAVFSGISPYEGMISPAYKCFKCKEHLLPQFVDYYFRTVFVDRKYKRYSKNVRYSISADEFMSLPIIVPPFSIQQRIADFLDSKCSEIDSLRADIEKEIETLEEYKKSVITEAVTKGLNPDMEMKETNFQYWPIIPANWEIKDIKYIFEIVKRIAGKEGYDVLSVTQNGLKVKDLSKNEGQIASDYSNYQFVYPTDYVMNHMDLLTGWVDCSTVFGVTSPDYRVFRLRNKELHNLDYFKYVLQSCYFNRVFYSLGAGVSNLGRWRLQTESFNNFLFPVPSKKEQEEISEFLNNKCSEINLVIEEKKQQLETLAEYKKSLIYEYVTGKKEVPSEEVPANEELNKNAVILGIIADKLGEQQAGRIQLQKVHFMMTMCVMMSQKAQYYRYNHGPYDVCLNDYIDFLLKNKWYQEKKGGAYILVKGEKHSEFLNTYKELIEKLEPEVDKLLNMLKSMNVLKTSRMERIATLYAAWNDLLLDGVSPTDDQIIEEVMNNWTENKGNTQYVTWQGSLEKMKKNGLIPKGTGKHTLPKQQ